MDAHSPAYNEEPTIAQVLGTVTHFFPEAEIIVVSDGSTDRTPPLAKQSRECVASTTRAQSRQGYAVRRGVLAATTPLVIFTDADLPFGVEGVRTIVRRLSEDPDAEMVIASKIGIKRGLAYRTARHAARAGIALLTGLRYADTQASTKGFPPAGGEGNLLTNPHRWLRVGYRSAISGQARSCESSGYSHGRGRRCGPAEFVRAGPGLETAERRGG